MEKRVKITRKRMESGAFGTASLIGLVVVELGEIDYKTVDLVLEFEESSAKWRQDNGGPHDYIVTEYTIPCMLIDLIGLQGMFKSVAVEHDESLDG